jgi:hypothetical protein
VAEVDVPIINVVAPNVSRPLAEKLTSVEGTPVGVPPVSSEVLTSINVGSDARPMKVI